MKKIFGLILLSTVLFSLVGCTTAQKSNNKVISKDGVVCDTCGQSLRGVDAAYSNNDPKF